jgi:hypothetical protein
MKFFIINKLDNSVIVKSSPEQVAIYLLARRIDNYIIVKSDTNADRVLKFESFDVNDIERICSEG